MIRYRCCEHCAEDTIHDVETDRHELWCNVFGCEKGKKAISTLAAENNEREENR